MGVATSANARTRLSAHGGFLVNGLSATVFASGPRRESKQAPRPETERRSHKRDKDVQRVSRQVTAFLEDTPHMRDGE